MTKDLKRQLSSLFSDMREPEVAAEQRQAKKGTARPSRRSQPPQEALPKAEETLTKRVQRLRTAAEISRAATSILDMDELLPKAVELVREGFDLYYAGLFLVDETGQWAVLRAGTGEAGRQMLTARHKLKVGGASMIGWCIANAQARIALDVGKEAVRFDNPLLPQTRSEMALPLISRGHIIGATTFQSDQPAAFADEDITILQTMADQLANAIENTRLLEDTKSRLAQLTALQETTRAVASTLELDKLLNLITQQATTLLQGTGGIINLVDWEKNEDEVVTAGGSSAHTVGFRSPLENSLSGWVTLHNQPVISNQLQTDNRVDVYVRSGEIRERNAAIAPLVIKDQVIGTLVVMNKQGGEGAFNQADLDLLVAFANQAAIAIQNARLFTETKRAEEALRISEERFALAVRGTNDGLWDWDIKGESLYWSPRLKELLGYADDELTVDFETFNRLMHPDDQERVTAALEAHLKDRVPYDVEERQLHKSGEYRWLRARGQALWDENGNPVRMVGFSTDITERKRTEEALQTSEEKYRTILENIQEGYFEVDLTGNFTFFNDALVRILGYPKDELMGMNNREYMDDQNARAVYQAFNAIYRTREPSQAVNYEILRRDGTRRSLEVSASLITDSTGEPIGFRGVMRDITERKQAEAELERSNEELSILNSITSAVSSSLDLDHILQGALTNVLSLTGFKAGLVSLLNPATGRLELVVERNLPEALVQRLHTGLEGSLCQLVYDRREPVSLRDLSQDPPLDTGALLKLGLRSYLGVPLESKGQVVGTLCIFGYAPHSVSDTTLASMQAIGQQIGVAVENARLFEEARTRAVEMAALNDLSRVLTAQLNLGQVLEEVYRGVSRLLDTTNFYMALYDPDKHEVSFPINVTESVIDRQITTMSADRGLTGHIIRTRQSLLIKDDVEGWIDKMGMEYVGEPARSWLGVPLMIGDQMLGVMAIQSFRSPRAFNEQDRDILMAISSQAAIAIQNARLFEESKRRITELSILNDVSQALSSALRLDELLGIVYQQVGRVFDTTNFYIATHEEDSGEWMMAFHMADGQRRSPELRRVEEGRTSHIIRTRQPLVLNTAQASIDFSASHGIQRSDDPTKSWMGVPLITGGRLVGVMAIHSSDRENLYSDQDLALFSTIGAQVAVAIQNARLFEQTRAALTETQALYEASRRIESASDLQEMVVALAEGFPVSGVEWAALLTFERDEIGEVQAVQVQGNWQGSQDIAPLPIGTRFSKEMSASLGLMLNTTPVFFDDTQGDERIDPAMAHALQRRNVRAAAVLPLGVGRNQSGVLMLASSQAHHFVEREIRGYVTLSGQMAVVVENRRLLQEAEARARREQVLREITARVRGSTDAETIARTAVRELGLALGRPAFIRLGSAEQLAQAPATQSANGNGAEPPVPGITKLKVDDRDSL